MWPLDSRLRGNERMEFEDSMMKTIARGLVICVLLLAGAGQTNAQGMYPDRPVRLIVPFAPAGPVDVVARLIGQNLTERFGKQFFVENQAGAGGTPIMFTTLAPAIPQITTGNLRALAVMAKARAPALPDVPTMEEAGFKDQEADTFFAMLVPAGTPKAIVELLYRETINILK